MLLWGGASRRGVLRALWKLSTLLLEGLPLIETDCLGRGMLGGESYILWGYIQELLVGVSNPTMQRQPGHSVASAVLLAGRGVCA